MEYTKVQTALNHVKDAITTKLDAIKTDVTNVNNSVTSLPTTLDSKFSALTSKVDGVKTDVAGVGSKVDAGVTTLGGKFSETQGYLEQQIIANGVTDSKLASLRHNYYDDTITKTKIIARAQEQSGSENSYTSEILLDITGSGTLEGLFLSAKEHSLYDDAIILIYIDGEPLSANQMSSDGEIIITDFEHMLNIESYDSYTKWYTTDVTPVVEYESSLTPTYYRSIKALEKITVDGRDDPSKINTQRFSVFLSKIKFEKSIKIESHIVGSYFPFNTWKPEVFITYTLNE